MVKLSQTSKLDGIKSWSLEAVTTCPGARTARGELVEVCQGCYARDGNYRFKNVKTLRAFNRQDWQREDWVDRMVAALSTERFFRWFDSGDVYHPRLAQKIHTVIARTYWCRHWLPTRSHKISRIAPILDAIDRLPNAVVRRGSDFVDQFTEGLHGAMVTSTPEVPSGVTLCQAYQQTPASCNGCRACWDKSVKTVAYLAHGRGMKRILQQAA